MLGALAGLSLSMDKSAYAVGERPTYRITGAKPGSKVTWTSYHDGVATGEYQAFYGDYVDEAGNATLPAVQPWEASHLGLWQKQVVIIPPEWPSGTLENALVSFSVGEVAVNAPPTTPPTLPPANTGGGGILSGSINLPIVGNVPTIAVLAGGALLFFAFSGDGDSGSRRR